MKNTVNSYVASFADMHRDKRRFAIVLCILAFFVALGVTWGFKMVGISIAGDANVSDSKADVETAADWEKTLPELGDDWLANVADIAKSQVGYTESDRNFIMGDDSETRQGFTRYGAWYGSEYNDWDAMFASFCLHYAGVAKKDFPQSLGAYSWVSELKKSEQYKESEKLDDADAEEIAQARRAGNLVFLDTKGDGRADAVAVIVAADDNGELGVVQGDVENKVAEYKINAKSNSTVLGYGIVPQNPKLIEQAEQAKAEAAKAEESDAADAAASKSKEEKKSTTEADAASDDDSDSKKDDSSATNMTEIVVCAQWEGDATEKKLKMALVANADTENPVDTLTLTEKDGWQDSFTDVPVTDADGKAITYNVVPALAKGCDVVTHVKTLAADALTQDGEASSTEDLLSIANADAASDEAKTASAQTVQDNVVSSSADGGSLAADRPALYAFAYTPTAYAGTADTRAVTATVPLTITKDWADGNDNHSGESVTVDVQVTYEDGSTWDQAATISSGDSWEKVVNVPANISITSCTVTERAIDGYDSHTDDVDIDATDVWIPVQPSAVKAGETYAVAYKTSAASSLNYVLCDSGYSVPSTVQATSGTNTIVYDGVAYYDYLTGLTDSAQWQWLKPASTTGRYLLKNAGTSRYVYETTSTQYSPYYGYYTVYGYSLSTEGGTSFYYSSSKNLMSGTSHYMQNASNATTSQSNATAYTFYKKIRATSKMSTTVHNRKTAAATESSTSVTVKKVWLDENGNKDNASHANDSVTLHLTDSEKGGATVSGTAPAVLNADNEWKADDAWQNLAEGTYSIEEDPVAGYNSTVDSVQNRKTIWIPVDQFEDGGLYAIVDTTTNKFLQAPAQTTGSATTTAGYLTSINSATSAVVNKEQMSFGGHTYTGYLEDSDTPITAQWMASAKTGGYSLRSSSMNYTNGAWLVMNSNWCMMVNSSTDPGVFSYNSTTKKLYASGSSYGLGTCRYYPSYYGYAYPSSNEKKFQLYKRVTLVDRTYTVTNAPITMQDGDAAGVDVEHSKYIDALRDGKSNPDTSLSSGTDLTDLYRLYLDAGPIDIDEPIDLLLVLDDSGSMATETSLNGTTMTRTEALEKILCGSSGVISKFLESNASNRVAMVSFAGHTPIYDNTYADDTMTLLNWTRRTPSSLSLFSTGGTNYSAGLLEAENLFKKSTTGNKKVMVFLSDGVPTFYVDQGVRYGHGGSDKGNSTSCIEPSLRSFDDFRQAFPDVVTYTVGFSEDITGNTGGVSTSPAVLRYYAEMGNGAFIQAKNADSLNEQISKLIMGGGLLTNASISDTLSAAVDVYDAQPDFKVVMQKLANGETTGSPVVLYENGQATKQYVDETDEDKSKDIVTSVKYDAATRTVKATFDPNYALDPEYRYTVSFNVKTTDKAYEDYANDKSAGGDGYDGMTGDANTDYSPYTEAVENNTSSNKLGFRSNTSAQLNFKRGNSYYEMDYEHPVIQVGDCSFQLKKVDAANENKLLSGARFSVYRKARTGEAVSKIEGMEGSYYRVATDLRTVNGVVSVDHLEPGTYWVVEDMAPDGYTRDMNAHEITLSRDAIVVGVGDSIVAFKGNENGTLVLEYTNKEGYLLPKTGGIGDGFFKTAGAALLVIAVGIGCVMARRRTRGGYGVPPC